MSSLLTRKMSECPQLVLEVPSPGTELLSVEVHVYTDMLKFLATSSLWETVKVNNPNLPKETCPSDIFKDKPLVKTN